LLTSNSWTRDNTTNNFLYNEGSELNNTSQLYDLPYRNYDAALGRFHQVDPLAHVDHSTSPFAYAGNNPIGANDPSGLLFNGRGSNAGRQQWVVDLDGGEWAGSNMTQWDDDNGSGGGGGSGGGSFAFVMSIFNAVPKGTDAYFSGGAVAQLYALWSNMKPGEYYIMNFAKDNSIYIKAGRSVIASSSKGMLGAFIEIEGAFSFDIPEIDPKDPTPWMTVLKSLIGTKECGSGTSEADNLFILNMLAAVGLKNGYNSGSSYNAWCAATLNYSLSQSNIPGTNSANANSFKGYGEEICGNPVYGAIGVIVDSNGTVTHVGCFDSYSSNGMVKLLGGNQGNPGQVKYSYFPAESFISWSMPSGYGGH
jgi:uncharacterized protein (TIGR02594 family)